MDTAYLIPLAALLISVFTLWLNRSDKKRERDITYVAELEKRLKQTEFALEQARWSERRLKEDNYDLMMRLRELEKDKKGREEDLGD